MVRLPPNRVIAVTTLVLGTCAALASVRIAPPFDTFAVVAAALLAGIALTSFLASERRDRYLIKSSSVASDSGRPHIR